MKQEKAQYKLRTLVEIVIYAIFSFAIIVLGLYVVPNAFTGFSTNHQIANTTNLITGLECIVMIYQEPLLQRGEVDTKMNRLKCRRFWQETSCLLGLNSVLSRNSVLLACYAIL